MISAPVVVAGICSDRLYPLRLQHELAELVPTADGLHVIASDHGHDGFLIETDQVGELVRRTLGRSTAQAVAISPNSAGAASSGFCGSTRTV
jgi:homoserine O-acetyltransferase